MGQEKLQEFIEGHLARIRPLRREANIAYWQASISGNSEDYDRFSRLELQIRRIYANPEEFSFLKSFRQSGQVSDPALARQLDRLYYDYLQNQIEPTLLAQIVDLSTDIEEKFNTFRGTIEGEKVTYNQIKEILRTETDCHRREQAWLAAKQVGAAVAPDLIRLVKLRNQAAGSVGFDNYHTLSLTATEQDVQQLDGIFEQLRKLTDEPFAQLKSELDEVLCEEYGVAADQLMPWHYHDPFFQEAPAVDGADFDALYKERDVGQIAAGFYSGIGLSVESILERSDLYERDGKSPHAFCTDIDREGDVRILCNLQGNRQWMETILHELGHAVYNKYGDPKVPYLLREPAHSFTTEAVAMFFGRLPYNAGWMQKMLALPPEQMTQIKNPADKYARVQQLIFVRWALVMYNFEKELYADPDQDLNSLWWEMVERYQMVQPPRGRDEPDWASKIHFTTAPCYYHNYMLGELLASQLHYHIAHSVLGSKADSDLSYVGRTEIGDFLRNKVFEAGALYRWNNMIELATGEPLTPDYFVQQFVK
jgi:peptidyl-dipeptidase A